MALVPVEIVGVKEHHRLDAFCGCSYGKYGAKYDDSKATAFACFAHGAADRRRLDMRDDWPRVKVQDSYCWTNRAMAMPLGL